MIRKPNLFCRLAALAGLLLWSVGALAEHYTVPLFVSARTSDAAQGRLRIVNTAGESGTVEISAIDDTGFRFCCATLSLNAWGAVELDPFDFSDGNSSKGLSNDLGMGDGHFRIVLDAEVPIEPSAYVRAPDGTLSAMHDTVRAAASDGSGGYTYEVPVFNPSTETTQVSRLRLINPGDAAAAVTIGGRDDSGAAATGGDVTLALPAGGARTLTAQQIEAGDTDLAGQLGAGTGKWRLTVSSDRPLDVVNVVASTAGYWNNLSTTAVAGAAPGDQAGFNERFVGNSIVYETSSARSILEAADGNRFTDTVEADGVTDTYMGSYSYRAIGPDAGLLTLDYDDGDACRANLYFSSRTSGWFASHCSGVDHPAEGSWLGGTWVVEAGEVDGDDGAGDVTETTYEVNDSLPGVPTSGFFVPAATSGGSVSASASGTTVALNDGGYIELNDGTRYTCASVDGCSIVNGTVTAGTVTGRAAGADEVDRFPSFRTGAAPGNQAYTADTAIATLTLPTATGGNGDLTYSLSPSVPGLTFNATARQLSGTPSTAGTHAMTYTVTDEDGDTDSLSFTITVSAGMATEGSLGVCQVGMTLSSGQSCTYPDTTDEFSVNARGRGQFLTFLAGIRIRIDNQTINGRVYDFEASHQGDGVWRIDRVAGGTAPPTDGGSGTGETGTDTSPSFASVSGPGNQTYTAGTAIETLTLPEASGGDGGLTYSLSPSVPGLTFNATTRQLAGTPSTAGTYAMTYTAADDDDDTGTLGFTITVREAGGDGTVTESFDLQVDDGNSSPGGIAYANNRFYVLDWSDDRVYAYSASGTRQPAAEFDLHAANAHPSDFTFADGRFYVPDWVDDKMYAYSDSGQRDGAAEFDLHDDNSSPEAVVFANSRFYVLDDTDDRVYAYSVTGQRDSAADFDLHDENASPGEMAFANGRFYVFDDFDDKAYAYSASGQRDAGAEFDLHADNAGPVGVTYVNDRFYVVDGADDKVYSYSSSGQREASADFDLPVEEANTSPAGITFADSRFYVLDDSDDKVYAYSAAGQREASADFDLHEDNASPEDIVYGTGQFYVLDDSDDKVYAYSASGQRNTAAEFDLDEENAQPGELAYANNRFFVVDDSDDKVYAYSASGQRDAGADFDLHADNSGPFGIVYLKDRFHIVDGFDDEVYAYWAHSGQRDTAADFDLHDDNGSATGITFSNGRFYVVDGSDDKVYSYPAPAEPDGPDLLAHSASVSTSELSAGATFLLSATVRNRGNQPAAATTLRYFRSTDPIISASDTEIGTDAVGGLSAGAVSSESISLTAPSENGCYFCGACVDAVDGDSTTSNNCSNPVVIAVGDQADLEVSRTVLHAPGVATLGVSTIRMTVDVTNNGPGASAPAILNFSGGRSLSLDIPALAPGETVTFERQGVGTAQLGTTRYRACIDYACDADTQNNCGSRSQTYTFASAPDGQIRRDD